MRFAIASDNETEIAAHTGRCQGFVIYDLIEGQPKRLEYRSNTYTGHARGQCSDASDHHEYEGHHSHRPLLDALSDCQALVTRGMGPRLMADLSDRGITPYFCAVENLDAAAALFAAGREYRVVASTR